MTTTTNDNGNHKNELDILNEIFANRYTEQDAEYNQTILRSNTPPIVQDWSNDRTQQMNRNNRQYYPNNNNRQQNRNYSADRRDDRPQHRNYSNDRQHDRDRSNHHHGQDRDRSGYRHERRH